MFTSHDGDPTGPTVRICLFDDVARGHHGPYLSGLVKATAECVDYVLVASPEPVPELHEGAGRWLPVTRTRHRQVIAGRRTLEQVTDIARAEDIDIFFDLNLDKTIWSWPRGGARPARTIHVLHHAHHYVDDRRGLARLRTFSARKRLLSWVERGEKDPQHGA